MKVRELVRILNQAGYDANTKRGRGGHVIFTKEGAPGSICVPLSHKSVDISSGLLQSIFRQAGIRIDPLNGEITYAPPRRRLHLAPGS